MMNLSDPDFGKRLFPFLIAGVLVCAAYAYQVYACAASPLAYFPYLFTNSDMHANLLWAKSIREQGWLNPSPHHPYNDWMQMLGTYDEWLKWWGGAPVFQQSPLYAYLLAVAQWVSEDLIYVFVLQALGAIALSACLGLIAAKVSGNRTAGWIGFGLAAAYAPFLGYSQVLVRDTLGWLLIAGLILTLIQLDEKSDETRWRRRLSLTAGVLLGLGFLARESFALFIPVVWAVCLTRFWKRRDWASAALMTGATCVVFVPLVLRNSAVGAPLFSTSNRFPEAFILGHARTAHPYRFVIPRETRNILEASEGKSGRLVAETLKTHTGVGGWMSLQFRKAASLLDPFESADNVSLYYIEKISPLVRLGVKHWMILVPGLGGLILSLCWRDRRHFWLWILFPLTLASVLVSLPLSRYRQPLALWWIPWTAFFIVSIIRMAAIQPRQAGGLAAAVVAGWILCLGPLARHPRSAYDRPAEYKMALRVYEKLGQEDKAEAMRTLLREKFADARR